MVRLSRIGLAAVPIGPPSVLRSRKRMRPDGSNTLKPQDNREGLRALPLNWVECEIFRRFLPQHDCTWPKNRPSLDVGQLQEVLEGRAQRRIVLDDEHQGLGARHAPSSLPIGSVN